MHNHTTPLTQQNSDTPLPPWIQNDHFFKTLPKQHRQTIHSIIQPLYELFVLQPTDHLERATGTSVIYLLWSELLKQAEISTTPYDDNTGGLLRRILLDDLFLLLAPKSRMSALLVRLRQVNSEPPQTDPPFPIPTLITTQPPQPWTPTPQP